MLKRLSTILVPNCCWSCKRQLSLLKERLCSSCCARIQWLNPNVCCNICGLPRPCNPCPARKQAFSGAWSLTAYSGPAADLVRALKFSHAQPLAYTLGLQLAQRIPQDLIPAGNTMVVPVPPHQLSTIKRGFDPVYEIAKTFSTYHGFAISEPLRWKHTAFRSQKDRQRTGRLDTKTLKIAYKYPKPSLPRNVFLVDDVHTTGTTLSVCAQALKALNAKRVIAISWARAI